MYHRRLLEAVAESSGIDVSVPWQDLSQEERDLLLEGTGDERHTVTYKNRFGRRRTYTVRFPGMLSSLERRYETTDSENTRERVEELMAMQPCPACDGARLRPEIPRGDRRRAQHRRVHAVLGAGGPRVGRAARADGDGARDRPPRPARSRRAPALPGQRRHRLPVPGAGRGHALRRRGAAHPPRHPDRLEPGRGHVHPRRAVDRPAPARQREADRHARAPARPRQHGDRGRARRGDDARRRPPRRPRPRRGRARGRGHRRGHVRAGAADRGVAHRPVPRGAPLDPRAGRSSLAAGRARRARRPAAQPQGHRRRVPARACSAASPGSRAPASRRS